MLSFTSHVQRVELWKCKHPVVSYCYLCILICIEVIQKPEKGKGSSIFVKTMISFFFKVTLPNVNSSKDTNKNALSVENEVAHYVCMT